MDTVAAEGALQRLLVCFDCNDCKLVYDHQESLWRQTRNKEQLELVNEAGKNRVDLRMPAIHALNRLYQVDKNLKGKAFVGPDFRATRLWSLLVVSHKARAHCPFVNS